MSILRAHKDLSAAAVALALLAAVACPASRAHHVLGEGSACAIEYALVPKPAVAQNEAVTQVRMTVARHGGKPFTVEMPVWTPGEYRVQNHGRNVRSIRATGGSVSTVAEGVTGAWRVTPESAAPVVVEYALPNVRPGVFTENVNVRRLDAFYSGPATFLYVAGRKDEPVSLRVQAPEGWEEALTPLDRQPDGAYVAPDYDALVDAPILVGDRLSRTFDAAGKKHVIAFFGAYQGVDHRAYEAAFRAIVQAGRSYMGELPYDQYVLFLDMGGRGGGLEHSHAARLALPSDLPAREAARFIAHEFFHLWNVKRIRPEPLGPFDYRKPPRTRNLWFCEGVTEYVAGLLALRAGLVTEAEYLQSVASGIAAWYGSSGRRRVTADMASLYIWDEGQSTGNGGVSVYTSGEMIGMCLDLKLLHESGGKTGLRDVLHDLMARHAPPKPGYGEDGVRQACIRAGGPGMGPFYDKLCRTTEELPMAECLGYAGLRLSRSEWGGFAVSPDPAVVESQVRLRHAWLYGQ